MTSTSINKAIQHLNLQIVRGEGYQYFLDLTTGDQIGDSVPVCRLKHLSLDRWVEEAQYARDTSQENSYNIGVE